VELAREAQPEARSKQGSIALISWVSCLKDLECKNIGCSDVLEQVAPQVWVITETNVPHKDNISYFGNGNDEAHMVYNFTLPPLLLLSFLNGDASRLNAWAATLEYPTEKTTFFNFTASHDGVGLQPLKGIVPDEDIRRLADYVLAKGGKVNYRTVAGQEPEPYELNVVYLSALGGNIDAFLASQAVQLSLRGVPGIYLNSFVGEENWIEGVEKLGYNRAINRRKFDYTTLFQELHDKNTRPGKVNAGYKWLLKARISEPLFSPSATQTVVPLDPKVFSLIRSDGQDALLVLVNISKEPLTIDASKIANFNKQKVKDILSGNEIVDLAGIRLSPYQVLWLK
jgi:sucrose phosphorylase